ncbi:MAG: VOC family protein [Planctomycetota bacterium]
MVKRLAHLCLVVSDLDKAVSFYRDALGMTEAFPFIDTGGRQYGQYLHAGEGTFLELFVGTHDPRHDGQSYRHFCLQVEDLAAEVDRLRTAGVTVSDIKLGTDRSYQAWLEDPDGNRIELHQYTPDSKQVPWAT